MISSVELETNLINKTMTIDEINTIRLALDTPEHNRHYIKHVTDAKMILNKEQEAINYSQCCKSDSEQLCRLCNKPLKEGVSLDYCTNLYCIKERA